MRLGEYLEQTGSEDACLAEVEHAVGLVPAEPPSPERAYALGSLAGALAVAWRRAESLPICEQALALARAVGAREAEVRALTVRGSGLAYLGRSEEGVADLRQALQLAEEFGDRVGLERAWVHLTDVLTMLGRLRESVRLGQEGLEVMRRYGIDSPLLVANQIEALIAIGDWDEADRLSAAGLCAITSSFPYWLLTIRAGVEIGRGELDAAREHTSRRRAPPAQGPCSVSTTATSPRLALWERRWIDAEAALDEGLSRARQHGLRRSASNCAPRGSRAQAELAALARARRDADAVRDRLSRARKRAHARRRRGLGSHTLTPPGGVPWPRPSTSVPAAWRGLRSGPTPRTPVNNPSARRSPPTAAGARPRHSSPPAPAPRRACRSRTPTPSRRIRAQPLRRELELLAERARLDPMPQDAGLHHAVEGLEEPRADAARGGSADARRPRSFTNREIAATLVISVKTCRRASRTSCASSMRRTGSKRPQSRTASSRHTGGASSGPRRGPVKASVGRAEITTGRGSRWCHGPRRT